MAPTPTHALTACAPGPARSRPRPRAENERHHFNTADIIAQRHLADAHKSGPSCKRRAEQTTRS